VRKPARSEFFIMMTVGSCHHALAGGVAPADEVIE
jgi:hypothetical protein